MMHRRLHQYHQRQHFQRHAPSLTEIMLELMLMLSPNLVGYVVKNIVTLPKQGQRELATSVAVLCLSP